jgi:hypothetical protein
MTQKDYVYTNAEQAMIAQTGEEPKRVVALTFQQQNKLQEISQRAPWLAPETVMALAQGNASTESVDLAAEYAARRELEQNQQKKEQVGNAPFRWVFDGIGYGLKSAAKAVEWAVPGAANATIKYAIDPFRSVAGAVSDEIIKPSTRWATATLDIIPETVQNLASMVFGSSNYDLGGLWESTSLATLIDNVDDQGDGFFMSQTLREEQAKRARAFRGTVYGNAFTMGRAITSVFGEGSVGYKYGSGIIDALTLMIIPDPTKYIAKGLKILPGAVRAVTSGDEIVDAIRAGGGLRGLVPLLSAEDADSVRTGLKTLGDQLKADAGLSRGITGASVDGTKFVDFMRTNPWAKKLVDDLVAEDDPFKILNQTFGYKISTDTAVELSRAKSSEEVISALTRPFTLGENTISANIGKYKVTRNPVRQAIRDMRFFTQMPEDTIVVDGVDAFEMTDSIRNMANSMRTAGVSMDKINSWGKQALYEFSSQGTAVGRNVVFRAYQGAVKEILISNGVAEEAAVEIIKRARTGIDRVQSYLSDRSGLETDNGMVRQFIEQVKGTASERLYAEFFDRSFGADVDFVLAKPQDLVQLLRRVQVLPNARELRRVTRNPLFSDALKKVKLDDKLPKIPLAARRVEREVTRYTDPERAIELKTQIASLLEQRTRLSGARRKAMDADVDELRDELAGISFTKTVKTMTGQARAGVELLDYLQNKVWKPLNLATVGYIVRNGIDAQIRLAMGGPASMFGLNPLEYISIAFGLPGENMRYGKSIAGVDFSKLGVAKQTRQGQIIPVLAGESQDTITVAGRQFKNTVSGRRRAAAHSKLTGRPMQYSWEDNIELDDVTAAVEVQEQIRNTIGATGMRVGFLNSDRIRHRVRTGSFAQVFKQADETKWLRGMIENLQVKKSLALTQRMAQDIAQGVSGEETIENAVKWLMSNRQSRQYRTLEQLHKQGLEFAQRGVPYSQISLPMDFSKMSEEEIASALRNYVRGVWYDDLQKLTGNVREIQFLVAYDAVPDFDAARNIFLDEIPLTGTRKAWKLGDKVKIDNELGVIHSVDKSGDRALATWVPIKENYALSKADSGAASVDVRRIINRAPMYDEATNVGLPQSIAFEQQIYKSTAEEAGGFRLDEAAQGLTNWLFNSLNDVSVRKLERSVAFRGFYYETIGTYANRLSYEEGVKLYNRISESAAARGETIAQWLGESSLTGGKKITKIIEDLPKRKGATGTLTIGELDDYARFEGIRKTKDLLYDASERNNIVDALRIVMPFADAWREVLDTYAVLGAQHNIHLYRKFARIYTGLEEADPDRDGRGVFFRDPATGEVQFQFPLSGSISKLLTGIDAPLSAPLGRLSQGINFLPALGPFAQFGLSQFVPDTPEYNSLKELFLPYGETTAGELGRSVIPGTLRKVFDSITANTENTQGQFAQTYLETMRALSVNPKYDLSTEEGNIQLFADARGKARVLTMMRAVSQFLGPSAGVQEWKVPTDVGDQYVGVLLEELRKFSLENYDTSIDKFLDLYGDDLMLYVSSKSQALQDGLEATQEFGNWELKNKAILNKYKNVGSYFAPMGSEYNFSVWERQLLEGKRKRLTDRELVALAQLRVGSVKYRKLRQKFGANPSEKQQEVLREYRAMLHEALPGFPLRPVFTTNKFENDIVELKDAIKDSRLADNPITPLVAQYLQARDQALQIIGAPSLKSKKAKQYRQYLFQLGESLAGTEPEFDRIWSRFLSQEVEL